MDSKFPAPSPETAVITHFNGIVVAKGRVAMSDEIASIESPPSPIHSKLLRKKRFSLLLLLSLFGRIPKIMIFWFVALLVTVAGINIGRQFIDGMLVRWDKDKAVHVDGTVFRRTATPEVPAFLKIALQVQGDKLVEVPAREADLSALMAACFTQLTKEKWDALANVPQQVASVMSPLRDKTLARIPEFATYYYAWGTGYTIMWEAAKSAGSHAVSVAEPTKLYDMVAADVSNYILKQYEQIVLRPEIMNSPVLQAHKKARDAAHFKYLGAVAQCEASFQAFVRAHTSHMSDGSEPTDVLDWRDQAFKMPLALYPRGGLPQLARSTTIVASGGVVGSTLAKAIAAKLSLKLATPFVVKALESGGMVATGSGIGSIFGPIGVILGAGGGLAIDYGINKGVELVERDKFEHATEEAVNATFDQWEAEMSSAIEADVSVWFDDTIQALAQYQASMSR